MNVLRLVLKCAAGRSAVLQALIAAVLSVASSSAGVAEEVREIDSAITHVSVIDVESGRVNARQTVVWRGRTITAVGEETRVKPPAGARVIDGSGKYLIPGLWDMHAHVLWPGLDSFFPLFIANGITGVRDMGTHYPAPVVAQWRKEVTAGTRPGPRFVWAGPVVDGPTPVWPGSTAVTTPEEARRAVRERKTAGMDFVKVYEFISRENYLAVIDEAMKLGIPVVGHVPQALSATDASNAGQRCIEHLSRELDETFVGDGTPEHPNALDLTRADTLADTFLRNNTWQCPTAVIDYDFNFQDLPEVAGRTELKYLPMAIRDRVKLPTVFPGPEIAHRFFRDKMALLKALHKRGVPMLAGTDCPMSDTVPGFSLHEELRLMVDEAGFSPFDALRAATLNPARFLHRERDTGTVSEGKVCDLVLLDANPLEDIRNTRHIAAVIADGKYYDRASLDKLLSDQAAAAEANDYKDRSAEELLKSISDSDQPIPARK